MAYFKRNKPADDIQIMRERAKADQWSEVFELRSSLSHLRMGDVSNEDWFWLNSLGVIAAVTLDYAFPHEWAGWSLPSNLGDASQVATYQRVMRLMGA